MKLLFFGRLRDCAGVGEREIDLPPGITTVASLREWIGRDLPQLLESTVRIAIDDRLVMGGETIGDAREIAFLPTVSGG